VVVVMVVVVVVVVVVTTTSSRPYSSPPPPSIPPHLMDLINRYNRARNHAANFSTILDAAFDMFEEVGKSTNPSVTRNNVVIEREGLADSTVTR